MEKLTGRILCHAHAELTNASKIIHKGPCLITGFMVAGVGADGTVDLYDGESAKGEHKSTVVVLNGTTFFWTMVHPVDFDNGIYIAVHQATTYVTICYIPESRKDFV